jgi:hypothetical protein
MALQSNLHYFKISIENPEIFFDTQYMVLEPTKDLANYVAATKEKKELLTTIKILNEKGMDASEIYMDLRNKMSNKFTHKSEFACFLACCDSSVPLLLSCDQQDFEQIVNLYLRHRNISEYTPEEWLQAVMDTGASRKKGGIGDKKLSDIAINMGFTKVKDMDGLLGHDKAVAHFSKTKFNYQTIRDKIGVSIDSIKNKQEKLLDIILKNENAYAFIEAKHLKELGGAQNHTVSEIIDVIKNKSNSNNFKFVSFCDGVYSNILMNPLNNTNNKIHAQYSEILKILKENVNSFWLNTVGFKEFVKDFSKL